MENQEQLDLHFPAGGVSVDQAVGKQPNVDIEGKYYRTSPDATNVRGYDTDGRLRGGSRPGIEKYVPNRPGNVRMATQFLGVLVVTGTSPVQPSQSGRKVMLVDVSQGTVTFLRAGETTWTTPTNNTGNTPALNATGLVRGAAYADKLYFVDGTNYVYFDGTTGTVESWTASSGSMPVDSSSNKARHICLWRGRIVLSGVLLNPNIIFMSKVADPRDWNYAPATPVPADSAFATSTGPQGNPGDVVNGLVPYTDNFLVVGMMGRLAIFRGDPYYGGSLDNLTTEIGMEWGVAWAMDSAGVIYFFSTLTGVFRMIPGRMPERISYSIDPLLEDIDTGEYGILLQWEDESQILHVWITLLAETFATTHWEWSKRSNAWFKRIHANTDHNPLAVCNFLGNDAGDRKSLIGGWSGYVYALSADAATDDGTAIESEVLIGPFLTKYGDQVTLQEVQGILAKDSGNVQYEVLIGETAEGALGSTPVADGTWTSADDGRNYTDAIRRSAHAAYLNLSSVVQWAFESCRALVDTRGKVQRRGK